MQYQLWAIVDNQPVDAGMLEMDKGHMMVKMKNIPRAQLFAITLEQEGGSRNSQRQNVCYVKVVVNELFNYLSQPI